MDRGEYLLADILHSCKLKAFSQFEPLLFSYMSHRLHTKLLECTGITSARCGLAEKCFRVQGSYAAIDSALSEVDRKDVRGIGISGQQHGFVPMDGDGQASMPWHAGL